MFGVRRKNKEVKNDLKGFGLSNWRTGVSIHVNQESREKSRFVRSNQEFCFRHAKS